MPAVMERERVADACSGWKFCPGEVEWSWRPSLDQPRTYPLCETCKRICERGNPGQGAFVRLAGDVR